MPIVNYVLEHTRFIEYATDEMLSMSERLLWYGLMDIMNHRAQGNIWPEEFIRIDNVTLCRKAGIKFDALSDARNKLKQRGRIDFIPGERNKKNPMYKMEYFYAKAVKPETENDVYEISESHRYPANWQRECPGPLERYPVKPDNRADKNTGYPVKPDNSPHNSPYNSPGNRADNNPGNRPNIISKHKDKWKTGNPFSCDDEENDIQDHPPAGAREEEEDPIPDRYIRLNALQSAYRQCFGKSGTPKETERILLFCHISGMPDIMAHKAMEIAAGAGPGNAVNYTLSVLADWKQHHVMQVHQIDEYQAERARREGKLGVFGTGDIVEDYRQDQEAGERRRQENIEAGLEKEYGT